MKKKSPSSPSLSFKDLPRVIGALWARSSRFAVPLFILMLILIYGFIYLRINTLNTVEPSPDMVTAQSNPVGSAHIDKTVVKQLQALQDNSVSVQTLFNDARDNPFQE